MYDGAYFFKNLKNGSDRYKTFCNILKQFKIQRKLRNFEKAYEIFNTFLIEKKTILVFDDIKTKSKIEDIIATDVFCARNNRTLIVTTQD